LHVRNGVKYRMKKNVYIKFFIKILFIFLIFLILSGVIMSSINKAPKEFNKVVTFSIKKGESLIKIADRLKKEQIINSSLFLRLICKVFKTEKDIKAGYYHIPAFSTTIDIYNLFISGKEDLIKVIIPEGWTLLKIAKHLEEKSIIAAEDFKIAASSKKLLQQFNIIGENAEGFLFPDTYFFSEGLSAEYIISRMIENFYIQLKKFEPQYEKMDQKKLYEKIIMASIIEREYRVEEEASIMASVFYNRVKLSMGLESCATLEYIISDILGKQHPEYISSQDQKIDSLYNTYKWAGFPPGPISNPGKIALDAAFNPAKTDYLYFVLKDKDIGSHYFSKNLEEHINAKLYFLKGYGPTP